MIIAILSLLIAVFFVGASPAMFQLPPEILSDLHLLRSEQAIREDDLVRARAEIDKILQLQQDHDLNLSEEFQFRCARAMFAVGLPERVLEAVTKYLTATGRQGPHYVEALELMNQAQDAIAAGKDAPVQASSQILIGAQSGLGGTPGVQTEPRDLPNTVETTAAPLALDCDLSAWNTRDYFKTATVEGVNACLAAGADPNARDQVKRTPLHWAAGLNENPAVVQALLATGADPNARNDDRQTPLHRAAGSSENPAVIEALLAGGAEVDARGFRDKTPLHRAADINSNPAVIEALLAAGADPNARNDVKQTPLYRAVRYNGNPAVIDALLAGGADPMARDEWKDTPLHLAEERNNLAAIEILRHPTAVRERQLAAERERRKAKSGPGFLESAIGLVGGVAITAAGGGTEEALAAGTVFAEGVIRGQSPAEIAARTSNIGPTGNVGAGAGMGECEIPGYPRPADVQNLGLSWCPATVDFQARVFALQAAGAQCSIATGSSSNPEQIQARRQEIRTVCARLAALGVPNCRCPSSGVVDEPGYSEASSSIDREKNRREQQAKQQEEARQAAQREKRRIEATKAEVLNSNCSCISIRDNGEYVCLDGFVGDSDATTPLCDIRR